MSYLKTYENFSPREDVAVKLINMHPNASSFFKKLEDTFGNLKYSETEYKHIYTDGGKEVIMIDKNDNSLIVMAGAYNKIHKFTRRYDTYMMNKKHPELEEYVKNIKASFGLPTSTRNQHGLEVYKKIPSSGIVTKEVIKWFLLANGYKFDKKVEIYVMRF